MKSIYLKSRKGKLEVGGTSTIKVNCNIGANTLKQYSQELQRLNAIYEMEVQPDTFMDLSLGTFDIPLYQVIEEKFGCPIGVVPTYMLKTCNKTQALDLLKKYADAGISFFTLHLTASLDLLKMAMKRKIPFTSRGGGILLQRMIDTGETNVWKSLLSDVIDLVKQYGIAISLGTTFRPAGIQDACDRVHLLETESQLQYCKLLQGEGVPVIVENVGHIDLKNIEKHSALLRRFDAPIMPLGPSPTDSAIGMDHIAAAIGAAQMGYYHCAHIINCITASEHARSFSTIGETVESIKIAKLTAHILDVSNGYVSEDNAIYSCRAKEQSCVVDDTKECTRCSSMCPLKLKI